jgi:transposase
MAKVPQRRFTAEFRQEAVRSVLELGLGVTEAARRLQMSDKTLGNWVYVARKKPVAAARALKGSSVSELRMQVSRLEAENARLKLEREILKKATAFFAKESP